MTNDQLVDRLISQNVLSTPIIIQAFRKVDRADFLLPGYKSIAYTDIPYPIGYDQTNSQPTTVAIMLEFLQPEKGERLLDVGSGSAWTTALLAEIVGNGGIVIGTERVKELVEYGRKNLYKYNYSHVQIKHTPEELGYVEESPYDRILVSASSHNLPHELVDQLKPGGKMVVPIKNSVFEVYKKSEGEIETVEHFGFSFVPLKT